MKRNNSMAGSPVRVLMVAVPCSVLSCLLTLWLVHPISASPVPTTQINTDELVRKFDDLLSNRIGVDLRTAALADNPPPAERQPISEETDADTLRWILDRLDLLLSTVRAGGAGSQVPDPQRYAPTNVNALEDLGRLAESDPEAASRSTLLLSPRGGGSIRFSKQHGKKR